MPLLTGLHVKNYRSLADVDLDLGPVNILFGSNGAGKSSFLDTLWFFRGCTGQGVDATAAERDHGIGLLSDWAPEDAKISIELRTERVSYELTLGFLSGRIDPLVGERLISIPNQQPLIERRTGSDQVTFYNTATGAPATYPLREPERASLVRYLDFDPKAGDAAELSNLIRFTHYYHSRKMKFYALQKFGSESGPEGWLFNLGENIWSLLRNLQGRRAADDRFDTIIRYMRRAFPSFVDVVLDANSPSTVYGSFIERGLRQPIRASGVSDGHLQLLLLLAALFAEGRTRASVVLFDEPEISLHPWALAVLAEAVEEAAGEWQRQVLVATHSPVLLSQFDASRVLAVESSQKGAQVRRLSEIAQLKGLLEQYSPGSLYMSELVGSQASFIPND